MLKVEKIALGVLNTFNMKKNKAFVLSICLFIIAIFIIIPSNAQAFVFQEKVTTAKALAHYSMGQIYDLLGLVDRAVLEYEKAAYFDESSYLIHLRRGVDYARLNMIGEAEQALKLVGKYNPADLQSHYLLALIYSTEKEYDKAGQEYEMILKTFSKDEPRNIEIYGYLGQLYYSQRKYDQAISQFEKILSWEPKNVDVMYLLGSLYSEVDKYDKAVDILKKALDIDPEHDGCLNTLGYIYAEKGVNLDEAKRLIEKALKISPDNGAYLDSLGWVYYKKGQLEKALDFLQKADNLVKDPVIYDHIGDVYLKMNKTEDAMKYWQLSIDLFPDQENVLRKLDSVKNAQVKQNL